MTERTPLVLINGRVTALPSGDNLPVQLTWNYLVFLPSTEAGTAIIGGTNGAVRAHEKGGQIFYRFIPSPYSAALDGFYSTYTGGTLSGLIVTRG